MAISEIYLPRDSSEKKIHRTLKKWGVAVLVDYFTEHDSDVWREEIIDWLSGVSGEKLAGQPENWRDFNLPYGPRTGMMQSIVGHCPAVWRIREAMYPLFKRLWGTPELYTSMDGATIHPPIYKNLKDWPHIDQTTLDITCIQGQAVLSKTTASFRCTPTSHLRHADIIEYCNAGGNSQWLKFNDEQINHFKKWFGDLWQVPIPVSAGSVILWYSNTIHSAKKNDPIDLGWRCAIYVCMRPVSQFTKQNQKTLRRAALEGRTTNHWGTKLFPKRPGHRFQPTRSEDIELYTANPESLALPDQFWTPLLRKLTAQESW